jgi:glycosyltransferase involved in cell wall biosynthesis
VRVTVVCPTVPLDVLGGLQHRLKYLLRGLADRGASVAVLQSAWAAERSRVSLEELSSVHVTSRVIPIAARASRPDTIAKLMLSQAVIPLLEGSDIVDFYDPVVVRTHSYNRAPRVYTAIALMPYSLRMLLVCGPRQAALGLVRSAFEPLALSNTSGLIVEHERAAAFARAFYRLPTEAVAVIPGGYDQHAMPNSQSLSSAPTIVYSGRLTWTKGLRELIKAFGLLSATHPSWRLVLVGDGPDNARLRRLADRVGVAARVQFLGRLSAPDTLRAVAQASIFAMPSYIESLPLSLIEAMALGKPVVATRVGGIEAHLITDGEEGFLVRPRSVRDLTDRLGRLMADSELRSRMGRAARRRTSALTTDRLVDRTLGFYRHVIDRGRQAGTKSHREPVAPSA